MRANEIATMLAQQADTVARMLLPGGKLDGSEWRAGDVNGGAGKSLGVCVSGSRAGVWKDFADDGKGGDLIDLWAAVNGQTIGEALRDAADYLGIKNVEFHGTQQKSYVTPEKPKCNKPKSEVLNWLHDVRGLSDKTISAYKLAESGSAVLFPSLRNGKLIRWKQRDIHDRKKIQTSKDSEPCLFGWQAINADARAVVICEGEIDACSWFQMGYPALSVPNGAQGSTWIESEYDNLERFDKIYLSFDNDDAGRKGVAEIIDRLGRDRCRVVEIPDPHKDANDLLLAGVDAGGLLSKSKTKDPEQLRSASEYVDEVIREFYPPEGESTGFYTPWQKVGDALKFRRGELTILAGANGHGKSEVAGHITLAGVVQEQRACIASMEFKPRRWLMRLTKQAGAMSQPDIPFIRQIQSWYDGKLWVFDTTGHAKVDQILSVFSYARRRYGIRLFVIDNLAKCGFAEDDYRGQKQFIDALTDFARDDDVHVILVAHLKKAQDESHMGNKFDVKGSGGITDMADTVLILWRNKRKEEARKAAAADNVEFNEAEDYDALLSCDKQRNGEDEPRISLWFDKRSHQFLEYSGTRPYRYVKFDSERIQGATQ